MLEWGQLTSQPGSLVRDAKRRPVFTGSRVVLRGRKPSTTGEVIELISEMVVVVSWGRVSERINAADLLVQR